mmetsp:Transcript_5132/g.13353  ORF Transcript_5132/g.13353 Transcript_5132/m.13353 type:complete len:248 (+) Transcript_5132:839-1582(+)
MSHAPTSASNGGSHFGRLSSGLAGRPPSGEARLIDGLRCAGLWGRLLAGARACLAGCCTAGACSAVGWLARPSSCCVAVEGSRSTAGPRGNAVDSCTAESDGLRSTADSRDRFLIGGPVGGSTVCGQGHEHAVQRRRCDPFIRVHTPQAHSISACPGASTVRFRTSARAQLTLSFNSSSLDIAPAQTQVRAQRLRRVQLVQSSCARSWKAHAQRSLSYEARLVPPVKFAPAGSLFLDRAWPQTTREC